MFLIYNLIIGELTLILKVTTQGWIGSANRKISMLSEGRRKKTNGAPISS